MPERGSSGRSKTKEDRNLAQIGLLAAIPGILIAGPLIGLFLGQWGDAQLGWSPWLTIAGTLIGLIAAGRQIWDLVRRSERIDSETKEK